MKPVSRKKAQELKDAGWERETYFVWRFVGEDCWIPTERKYVEGAIPASNWLPAPTVDEVLEDLDYRTMLDYFALHVRSQERNGKHWDVFDWRFFAEWESVNMRDADKAADVWIKTRGKR